MSKPDSVEELKSRLREISNLCENWNSLDDIERISRGSDYETEKVDGCDKCGADDLQAKIDALAAELLLHRWIPVSEGPPKEGTIVELRIVRPSHRLGVDICLGNYRQGTFWRDQLNVSPHVTHYRPIIMPAEGE